MSKNKYKLGNDYIPNIDDITEYRIEAFDRESRLPRNLEKYWNVRDRNLQLDHDSLEKRVLDHYKADEIYIPEKGFVTDDQDLFVEMYHHLKIDFVYDFGTRLFFMDLFGGHECLMGNLYECIKHLDTSDWEEGAEKYVIEGYGFYKSSQSPRVWIGPDVAIPDFFRPWKHQVERME